MKYWKQGFTIKFTQWANTCQKWTQARGHCYGAVTVDFEIVFSQSCYYKG